MSAGSTSWPPAWTGGASVVFTDGGRVRADERRTGFPPASWPSHGQLDYVRLLVTALLLVLALPWLAFTLLTRPGYVLSSAGQRKLSTP